MHDQIDAELERTLTHGRCESVVAADECFVFVRELSHGRDVGQIQHRVRGRLDPYELGSRLQRRTHGLDVGHVDESVLDTEWCKQTAQLQRGAVVRLDRCDDAIARAQQMKDGERGGRTGGISHRANAAFQRRDALLECLAAWIVRTTVGIAARKLAVRITLEGRAQVNGWRDVAAGFDFTTDANRKRLEFHDSLDP